MTQPFDEQMMTLALATGARGRPSPNPHVGAVVVRDGEVLATGYHHAAGEAHAEVDALEKLGGLAPGATLYVTLEPCNHVGRTGPCADYLLQAGVSRVVIGCEDRIPGHGGGAAKLRAHGVEVQMGVMREAAEALVADFYKRALEGLPYLTLKAALTLDGRMAARTGDSRWITGEEARKHAHRMRDRADAVLVGVGTVLADDPELTVRHVQGQDPVRVVLDSALRTPLTSKLLRSGRSPVWIFHTEDADTERALRLRDAGAVLFATPRGSRGLDLDSVLRELSRRDVMKLLVEGGPHVHGALLDGGFVDRVSLFFAPRILGDAEGMPLAFGLARTRISEAFHVVRPELRKLGEDLLIEGRLERPKEA